MPPPTKQPKVDALEEKIAVLKDFVTKATAALKAKPPTSDKEKKVRFDSVRMRNDAVDTAYKALIQDKVASATPEAKKAIKDKVASTALYGTYRKALEAFKF